MSMRVFFKKLFFIAALAFGAISSYGAMAASQDEGLYDKLPPEGSAFVRFIHAQPDISQVNPTINGKVRDGAKFGEVKPYGAVMKGKVSVEFGPAKTEFDAEAKAHYTVILQNKTLRVVKDPAITDELKTQIIVYNLTAHDDIALKTADGKVSVVGPVKANEVLDRAVNPIKVVFAVYAGEKKFADVAEFPLERKASYAIAVFDENGTGKATEAIAGISEE